MVFRVLGAWIGAFYYRLSLGSFKSRLFVYLDMLRLALLTLLCLWLTTASALNLDSLWGVWNDKSQPDTSRLRAIHKIAWDGYLFSQPDSAFYFAQKEYKLAKEKNLSKHMANALNIQGVSLEIRGNYYQALEFYKSCLRINQDIGDKDGVARSFGSLAGIYQQQGDFSKAIDYHTRCLRRFEETGDKQTMCIVLNNIGTLYKQQGEVFKALGYYKRCLKINEELNDQKSMAYTLNNIGLIHLNQGANQDAMKNFTQALKIFEHFGNKINMASTLNKMGVVYNLEEDFSLAKEHFEKSLTINEELGNKNEMAYALINIGEIYKEEGKTSLAIQYISRALKLAKEIGNVKQIKGASEDLYKIYKLTGQYQKAMEMHELTIEMHEKIINEENTKAIVEQEYKYEYEKKAVADSIRNAEAAKVTKAQLDAQIAENARQQQQAYFLYAGLALTLLFGGIVFNRFTLIRKQKKVIEEQKQKLEEQKQAVTDSIRYAKNIQQALLPTIDDLKEVLPDGFVLFQPKDIVSGDFYWMQHHNDRVYLAVCDCTGHGVPGAFMSMIGSALLDEVVVEKGLTQPNEIFNEVRKSLINALKQTDDTQKDGMDAVLIAWDKQSTLQVAAAYNPMLIIRNGEIIEIKPDKQPVGFQLEEQKDFTHHKLKLEKKDTIYLFSDGYPDQFGGPKGRKFMIKRFKQLLLSIQDKTMNEQKTILETTMAEWKGDTEQVDDILVMGVQF